MNTENNLEYHLLTPQLQRYLHEIELRECATLLTELFGLQDSKRLMKSFILRNMESHLFEWELDQVLARRQTATKRKERHILYYLSAGVGIKRIMSQLQCGQPLVYRIKEADHSNKIGTLNGLFEMYPHIVYNISMLKSRLNVLDGHDVQNPYTGNRAFPTRKR